MGRREGRAGMRAVRGEWLKRVLMGRGWGEGRGGEGWYEGSERGVVEESVDGARARVNLFCGTCVNESVWDKCEEFI